GWFATGERRSVSEILDDLAPEYDYAVVEGFSGIDLPAVVLGDREHAGRTLAAAPEAADIDLDALRTAIEELDPHVTLESLVREAKTSPEGDRAGAIATF